MSLHLTCPLLSILNVTAVVYGIFPPNQPPCHYICSLPVHAFYYCQSDRLKLQVSICCWKLSISNVLCISLALSSSLCPRTCLTHSHLKHFDACLWRSSAWSQSLDGASDSLHHMLVQVLWEANAKMQLDMQYVSDPDWRREDGRKFGWKHLRMQCSSKEILAGPLGRPQGKNFLLEESPAS